MKYIYQLIGSIFPINLKFSLITIPIALFIIPIGIASLAFLGTGLILLIPSLFFLALAILNLTSYIFKKKNILSSCEINLNEKEFSLFYKYSLAFKEPFIEQSRLSVAAYFLATSKDYSLFCVSEEIPTKYSSKDSFSNIMSELIENEKIQNTRQDTLWGDMKYLTSLIIKNKTSKARSPGINLKLRGDASESLQQEKSYIHIKPALESSYYMNFMNASFDHNNSRYKKFNVEVLQEINSYIESRGKKILFTSTIILTTGLLILASKVKNHSKIKASKTLNQCQKTTTFRFITAKEINRILKLDRQIIFSPDSPVCLSDFYSQTEDKSITFSGVFSKYGKISSFNILYDIHYDAETNLNNIKSIKSLIKDTDFNIKFDRTLKNSKDSDFFKNNINVDGGIIEKLKNGNVKISYGFSHSSNYNIRATKHCLKSVMLEQSLSKYNQYIKSIQIASGDLWIELKKIKYQREIIQALSRKNITSNKSCPQYLNFKLIKLKFESEVIAGSRANGQIWLKTQR